MKSKLLGRVYIAQSPHCVSVVTGDGCKIYRAIYREEGKYEIEAVPHLLEEPITWKHLAWESTEDAMWATLMRFVQNYDAV